VVVVQRSLLVLKYVWLCRQVVDVQRSLLVLTYVWLCRQDLVVDVQRWSLSQGWLYLYLQQYLMSNATESLFLNCVPWIVALISACTIARSRPITNARPKLACTCSYSSPNCYFNLCTLFFLNFDMWRIKFTKETCKKISLSIFLTMKAILDTHGIHLRSKMSTYCCSCCWTFSPLSYFRLTDLLTLTISIPLRAETDVMRKMPQN